MDMRTPFLLIPGLFSFMLNEEVIETERYKFWARKRSFKRVD